MPIAKVQLPNGKIGRFEVPEGTTPDQVLEFAKGMNASPPVAGSTKEGVSPREFLEPVASVVSSVVAEPLAGLAGIAQSLNPFADPGAGGRAVEATREALTYKPRTEVGQQSLQEFGDVVEPIAKVVERAEKGLGDTAFEVTGSPTLAAAATTIPTLITEVLGLAAGRGVVKGGRAIKEGVKESKIAREMSEAAPTTEQLKEVSRGLFKEVDEMGVSIKGAEYNELVKNISGDMKGLHPKITPSAQAAYDEFLALSGEPVSLSRLDDLRSIADGAAGSLNKRESMLGVKMINAVDDFLDTVDEAKVTSTGVQGAEQIGKKVRLARDLWGKARRSETLERMFEKARLEASGFENGIRMQFRQLLKNDKKIKMFKPDEVSAMKRVVMGSKKENLAKLIGRFGFSEGGATNALTAMAGVGGGAAVGGPVGAMLVPMVGQVSRKLAQRMTAKNAAFADQVIRGGKNGRKITEAYIKNTPKAQRTASELSELLIKGDIDMSKLPADPIVKQAKQMALQRRAELSGLLASQQYDLQEQ